MQLNQEDIDKFKEIYKEEFGKEISNQRALELAQNLLNLFQAIYKPIPFEKMEEFEKLRNFNILKDRRSKNLQSANNKI